MISQILCRRQSLKLYALPTRTTKILYNKAMMHVRWVFRQLNFKWEKHKELQISFYSFFLMNTNIFGKQLSKTRHQEEITKTIFALLENKKQKTTRKKNKIHTTQKLNQSYTKVHKQNKKNTLIKLYCSLYSLSIIFNHSTVLPIHEEH